MIPELPPDTLPSALAAWLLYRQSRTEARLEEIASQMKLPPRRRKRWRGAVVVVLAILLALFTGNSQKRVEPVNNPASKSIEPVDKSSDTGGADGNPGN